MAAGRHLGFDPTGNGAILSAVPVIIGRSRSSKVDYFGTNQ